MQIPREARDKAVALPAYLQHSRCYELRTEYCRWQTYHPESLPFGPSSVANICAALDLDNNLPPVSAQSSQSGSSSTMNLQTFSLPRRALDECAILVQVLKALLEKSEPANLQADVFARPLDAMADVKAFLAERSKVLHLAGLPHDTTQSELESWFTQHGGRPTAFWTLRTPDSHKPTGTGFAVFSSHEEVSFHSPFIMSSLLTLKAAESLGMNGRALGDKAIEVSPSSSRVLEKAAEILTPFPPSKNRPRPGDWTCPSCGFSNFQRRTSCFRCSFPANQAQQLTAENPATTYTYPQYNPPVNAPMAPLAAMSTQSYMLRQPTSAGSVPFRAGDWKCGAEGCAYHNFAKNVTCLRCGASRSQAALVAESTNAIASSNSGQYNNGEQYASNVYQNPPNQQASYYPPMVSPPISANNSYPSHQGGYVNSAAPLVGYNSISSSMGQPLSTASNMYPGNGPAAQMEVGDWNCPSCNFINFRRRSNCLRCNCANPNPTSAGQAVYTRYPAQSSNYGQPITQPQSNISVGLPTDMESNNHSSQPGIIGSRPEGNAYNPHPHNGVVSSLSKSIGSLSVSEEREDIAPHLPKSASAINTTGWWNAEQ